jgi:hypothetical protein
MHQLEELIHTKRFVETGGGAEFSSPVVNAVVSKCGDQYHRGKTRESAHPLQNIKPRHARHLHVADQQVNTPGRARNTERMKAVDEIGAIHTLDNLIAVVSQDE